MIGIDGRHHLRDPGVIASRFPVDQVEQVHALLRGDVGQGLLKRIKIVRPGGTMRHGDRDVALRRIGDIPCGIRGNFQVPFRQFVGIGKPGFFPGGRPDPGPLGNGLDRPLDDTLLHGHGLGNRRFKIDVRVIHGADVHACQGLLDLAFLKGKLFEFHNRLRHGSYT